MTVRDAAPPLARYVSGSWALLCGVDTWVLADVAGDAAGLERLWALVDGAADVSAVLDEIATSGAGREPGFALIHLAQGAERAVVSGTATVRVAAGADELVLSCESGIASRLECRLARRPTTFRLVAGSATEGATWLPITGGITLASAVEATLEAGRAAQALAGAAPLLPVPVPVPEQEPADDVSAAEYDFLFEATQRRSVEAAAVRPVEEEREPAPAAEPPGSLDPGRTLAALPDIGAARDAPDPAAAPPEPPPALLAPPAARAADRAPLIASVPGVEPSRDPRESTTAPFAQADPIPVDDRTVRRDEVVVADPGGPLVHAVPCPAGHPNPPHSATCRICGAPIGAANPITMPRPVLGVLRLSTTGDPVPLDRSAIFGRSPELREDRGERPHLVRLPSPDKDISRNHVEVTLDGWHVLVTDLGSTNGTLVTVPGQPPQRLRAGEPFPIPPGSVVSLAEVASFVYEVAG